MAASDWVEVSKRDQRTKTARRNRPFGLAPWKPEKDSMPLINAVIGVRDNEAALAAQDGRQWLGIGPRQYAYRVKTNGFVLANGASFDKEHFSSVERILVRARRVGWIGWDDVTDGRGTSHLPAAYADNAERLRTLIEYVPEMEHPRLEGQEVIPELFVETEGLFNLIYDVADEYGVRSMTASGQSSVDLRYRLARRVAERARDGISTVVLALADYDTHGDAILAAIAADTATHLRDMGTDDDWLTVVQVALTPAMVTQLKVPTVAKTIHGVTRQVQEVEAVPTTTLRNELREAIEHHIDLAEFERVAERRAPERDRLRKALLGLEVR